MTGSLDRRALFARVRGKLDAVLVDQLGRPLTGAARIRGLARFAWAPFGVEPFTVGARIRGALHPLLAWPTLLLAMRRRDRRTELWIGDSHAVSMNRSVSNGMFLTAPDGQLILRAGAKLMYSLAYKGFPARVVRVATVVQRFGRRGALVPIFSAGEIDIRVHLADHPGDFGFVADYVAQCMRLAQMFKATIVGFAVPVPPVDVDGIPVWFPVNGSIGERVKLHAQLRDALADAVDATPNAVLLDCTDLLADSSGAMSYELTTDGAHTNRIAVSRVRSRVRELGLAG